MKKVTLQLNGSSDPKLAGQVLGALSGVMVTDVQGDTLIVHCGERLDSRVLLDKLREKGCSAAEIGEAPEYF